MPADAMVVAERLGLERRARRWGPCPACRADRTSDGRPPVRIAGGRWWCNACAEAGDGVTLASWAMLGRGVQKGDSELRAVFDWLQGRDRDLEVRVPQPEPEPPPEPPPHDELVRALRACTQAAADSGVATYLRARGIDPERAPAGALPTTWDARWWRRAWSGIWRLVVPAFDGRGRLRTLHARAIVADVSPKTRWPLGCDARGVLFADALGRALLRGQPAPDRLVVTEGLPDFLLASVEAAGSAAVISVESGSGSALREVRLDPRVRVYVATHADLAGDRYAQGVADAFAPHPCRRVPLHLLRRRAA